MLNTKKKSSAWKGVVIGMVTAVMSGMTFAEIDFPAIDRPAMHVKEPSHVVLQAAAIAAQRTVVVGEHGVVALSSDAGKTWTQSERVPTSVTLTALTFVDANSGWAVGHGGVVLHTTDGGNTWVKQADGRQLAQLALAAAKKDAEQNSNNKDSAEQLKAAQLLMSDGPDKPLLDVMFLNPKHGFVIGAYNLFFETMDAGKTWQCAMGRLKNPKGLHLYALRTDGENFYIAGEQGFIARSRDNGTSFENLKTPYIGSWFSLASLGDGALVMAGLRGNAYFTGDAGETWKRLEGSGTASFVNVIALPNGGFLLANQAGQLWQGNKATPLTALKTPSLPPIAAILQLSNEQLLTVGMLGAITMPLEEARTAGAEQ